MTRLRNIIVVAVALLGAATTDAQVAGGREYQPTINWPYVLDDFYDGTIMLADSTVSNARLNFHLRSEALDCVTDEGKVAHVLFQHIDNVVIKDRIFRFVNSKPMLQVYAEEGAMLMDYEYIDFDLMDKGKYNQGVALYARQTSETSMQALHNTHVIYNNLHMPGEFNESYADLRNKWFDGDKLPVRHTMYFVVSGKAFRAIAKDCNEHLDKTGQKQLKQFMKSRQLSWKNKADLIKILLFMKQQMT